MGARRGILAAGVMLVDYVHRISHWPEQGWLAEVEHSEKAAGGAPLNVLLTLSRMQCQLPLVAIGLLGNDADGDYLLAIMQASQIDHRWVQRTGDKPTAMTQVMTAPDGQRTFFFSPGANALLDRTHFAAVDDAQRIFHLGYLLLLETLDGADSEFGTRSARLLAQMQQRGYFTSLDLASRAGDYRPQVLPALRWLDYLVINELEAQALSGVVLRDDNGIQPPAAFALAAQWLAGQGVRQRVVIHAPEGAWGQEVGGEGIWQPAWQLAPDEIVGSVGAGDAFCAGVLYASHEGDDMLATLQLAHTCARFNLRAANAVDGIRPLTDMRQWMAQAVCVESREPSGLTTSAEKT
ncbi:carbohydrate kinase family protein [Pantoea ananatis]|uniref:carbohydrate kinase family protein n=1 Tax=Pantoea ananas TaxID=553 RepID=UPI0007DAC2A6|nr:carbohydrate kinase family protein [Pantoea ananatis]MCW0329349.1 putative sugar kinase YdjH [Pantoea ananatis]UYL01009.1 carbohydrate kinase family protein [Pantoea ananatis]